MPLCFPISDKFFKVDLFLQETLHFFPSRNAFLFLFSSRALFLHKITPSDSKTSASSTPIGEHISPTRVTQTLHLLNREALLHGRLYPIICHHSRWFQSIRFFCSCSLAKFSKWVPNLSASSGDILKPMVPIPFIILRVMMPSLG